MNIKELKKLAAACRKAGISHFKSADYEFTLTEDAPKSAYKLKTGTHEPQAGANDKFESDSLSESDLMFWSVGNPLGETKEEGSEQ